MHRRLSRRLALSAVLVVPVLPVLDFVTPVRLHAQTFRGGINGTVTDPSGASVPGAEITVTNNGTAAVLKSKSSSSGDFLFNDLPLGEYSITVAAPGFATSKFDKVPVSAGTLYTLPAKLSVSTSSETVEVDAASIALDTTSVTQTTVLSAKTVEDLPLNGRDFTQMVQLTPGFAGYVGGGYGSLNGTRANQMNWQIDGVDNNDLWHNIPAVNQGGVSGIAGIILPIDAVDQFSAQTQAGPEGGRNPGGTINLTLKSGTNRLHGTVYYFNRNELFGAKSPFSTVKQKVRNYNTGFSVGGPFFKDKLFGFLTFEHQRFVIGQSGNATVPSIGWQEQAKQILAKANIPVLQVMQTTLDTLWATGNLGADNVGIRNNYHASTPEFGYSWNGLGKVDWAITGKDNLSVHWFVGQGNQVAPTASKLPDFYELAPIHVQNIAIVENHLFTSHISNQILAGVNYFNQVFDDVNADFSSVQKSGFVTGTNFSNAPRIVITGFTQAGATNPQGRNDITGHLTDQLSYLVGKHEFRFGGEYRNAQLDEFYHRYFTGNFTFDGSRVGGNSTAGALADFLAGQTSAASITIGDPNRQVFVNTWFLNAGDSWKATDKLTVNYGARYDYVGPLHNPKYQNLSVFRPELTSQGGLAIQGKDIDNLYQRYFGAVSPRVGVTYQLSPLTVLRAGYGWYFDTINLNPFLDNRPGNQAPNGVEGNPVGSSPVATLSATNNGKTQIVEGQNIFGSASFNGYQDCTPTRQCGIFSVSPAFRPAVNQNFSFNVEQTLARNVIGQIGYVGSQGRHLLALRDINQLNPIAQTRPYSAQYPGYSNINEIESIGTSNYNSLQTQLRIQNWHRVSASATYTWSHSLDEVTAYRGALPQDNFNFKGDYGNSDFDTRNNFVGFFSYEVPGSDRLKALTNGWQANALLSFHGGQPFSVHASGDISGTNEGNDRADQVGNPNKGYQGQHPGVNWLDPSAFADPAPLTFGSTRRNAYFAPGYSDVDLSVFKNTRLGEWATVQFRAEMFNIFNRNNFAPPGPAAGGDFTLSSTIGDYNGAPGIGAGEPFNTQFGAKIIF